MHPGTMSGGRVGAAGKVLSIILLAVLAIRCGKESATEPQLPSGPADGRIGVDGSYVDEYYKFTSSPSGPIKIQLTGSGVSRTITLTPTAGQFVFESLPRQQYLLSGRQDSCYPFSTTVRVDNSLLIRWVTCTMKRIPPAHIHVDSIICYVNPVAPRVDVRLIYPFTLPAGGTRSIVLLAGLDANVSTRLGTYVFAHQVSDQSPGPTQVDNIFPFLQWSGIKAGQRVYLTARLANPATSVATDAASGLPVFSNIESTTTAIASFIMP